MKPDMQFGWRPEDVHGAPIPMNFDYETYEIPQNPETKTCFPVYFYGNRFIDSITMHKSFSNRDFATGADSLLPAYFMRFPPQESIINAMIQQNKI